ncbi:MAG: iron uptake porin [Microcoleaceae cyanobacterium]
MNKILLNVLKQSSGILGVTLALSSAALATEASSEQSVSVLDSATEQAEVLTQMPVAVNGSAPAQISSPEFSVSQSDEYQMAQMEETTDVGISELEQITIYADEAESMEQVTSVSQLSDVQPTDWAFQALQSLVERYGCIAGYPDGTYKGNRAMTRYEFAAGLNACLERVNELIAASVANLVTREDLAVLQRLQEEFAAELAALRGRVLALEARTAELEANQFSTTTKLSGEAIFQVGDSFGERALYNVNGDQGPDGTGLVGDNDDPTQTYVGYRVRLNFDTSFTGKDRLRTRLQMVNVPNFGSQALTNTLMARQSLEGNTDGNVTLDDLVYSFPVFNDKGQVLIGASSLDLDDLQDPVTPSGFSSPGAGIVSRFARYNPTVYRGGAEGGGLVFKYAFSDAFQLNLGYLANDTANADDGSGIFNGSHTAAAQFVISPVDNFTFGVSYNRRYSSNGDVDITGSTGSFIASRPFGNNATTTDNLGLEMNWGIVNGLEFGGWFGATWADQKNGGNGDATILNWAAFLAFPDAFSEGDLGGLIVGMPPKVTSHDIDALEDNDTTIHIEAFYRYQLNDFIAITPGVFVVTNPDHNDNNDTIVVGTLRTQFRF